MQKCNLAGYLKINLKYIKVSKIMCIEPRWVFDEVSEELEDASATEQSVLHMDNGETIILQICPDRLIEKILDIEPSLR